MKTTLCVSFYLCIATVNSFVSNDFNHLVKEVCRGEQSCSEENKTLPANSCCRPCECEDFCQEKGTCCDGNRTNRIENVTAQVCLLAGLERSSIDGRKTQLNPYLVRAHCPESFTNHSTRDKCETSTPESIEDGVFVSSKNGKIVYKNRHCALCHGEEDPIMWTVGVDEKCVRDVFLSRSDTHRSLNASYINEKLMTSCTISFDRPSITGWKHVTCAHEGMLISSCPEMTSQNRSSGIDKELNELCLEDKSALSVFHGYKWQYANVYCYLCNEQKAAKCDTENPDKVLQSITLLLDLSLLRMGKISPEEEEEEKGHQCTGPTFYDELFDTCREIRCQMFDVASEGKCISIAQKGKMNYAFNFELVPKQPWNRQQWNHVDISEFLDALSTFQSKLGFRKCRRCSVNVRYNLNPTMQYKTYSHLKFYLQFVFTTTPYCERKYLLSRAEWLENGQHPASLAQNITFTARYIWSQDEYTNITESLITVYHKYRCRAFDPSRLANCPKITLSLDEFVKIGNLTRTQQLKAVRNEYDGFDVCLDEYKRYVHDIKSHSAKSRYSTNFVLIPLFLIFIVLK
ncbi:uncharacterized protein LOC123547764 [Mercenaria mercenaria]|uniref:uncharacterized protein LOC123547764 n=1 Tax=Mercenaria mercenaria TaxID=6596 RepID=UPI00234E5C6A|nr:uncharacterized protein LOC123547764 [Mercenaria mercenaria]